MSAEDRAAQRRIPDGQFNEILRVIRETVRSEMRAEREATMTQWYGLDTQTKLLSGLQKVWPPEGNKQS